MYINLLYYVRQGGICYVTKHYRKFFGQIKNSKQYQAAAKDFLELHRQSSCNVTRAKNDV